MGTCCASRTDMAGKTKTGSKTGNQATPGGGVAGGKSGKAAAVVFNPMDEIRDTVMQLLQDTANHEILVVNLPKSSFEAFVRDMRALLTLINQHTQKFFVPISLTHSPIDPSKFIIVLRTHENVH